MGTWLVFDDETVDTVKECDIPKYFGDSNSGSAYVLYYQALDIDLSALGLRQPTPEPVTQPDPQSEPIQQLQPTDSPVSAAQSIPPLPPGLTDDTTSVPEALPRPTTPPIPIQLPPEPAKSPRKVPSQFLKVALGLPATAGRKSSRPDSLIRPPRSVLDEKFSPVPKPSLPLSPIAIFAKDDLKPSEGPLAGGIDGKERDSEKSVMGWFRWRSSKAGRSRPSSEVTPDTPPLLQDIPTTPSSPVRNQSTDSSSNSWKDFRAPLDSPTPGHAFPRFDVPPLPNGKLPPLRRATDMSPYETDSRQSSASGSSCTTPISPPPDRRSYPRPLPAIPASPQTPKIETPSSPFSRTTLDHNHVQRRPGMSSVRDSNLPPSPKSPSRPATSAGAHTKIHSQLPSAPPSNGLQVPSPNMATSRSGPKNATVLQRPRSAHASYNFTLSPPTSPVPPLPASATSPRRSGMRRPSLSAQMLGFVKRDKDKQ